MRRTGNRPQRSAREENRLNREMRSENTKLKRENARLRKELGRREASLPSARPKPMVESTSAAVQACHSCSSTEIKFMNLPSGKRLIICGDCGIRVHFTVIIPKGKKNADSE